jgi:thiamine transport system substrate-binding protein
MDRPSRLRALVIATAALLPLTACSLTGGEESSSGASGDGAAPQEVVLVTHDSFFLPKKHILAFERDSGYDLVVRASGDGGTLTNKLVLSQGNPQGDVAFGVDNTFASRALDNDVFAPYAAPLPAGAEAYVLPGDEDGRLAPVDNGNVCVNIDTTWFAAEGIAPPESLDDLAAARYRGLLVVESPATSTPGLAFLLATIAHFGEDGWQGFWRRLRANDVLVVDGWEEAYSARFSGAAGSKGERPIVVSYASSTPAEVYYRSPRPTEAPTAVVESSCYRQVELAGVLRGARNEQGAHALIDFLLSRRFQEDIPLSMFVFPVNREAALPPVFERFAVVPASPLVLPPAEVESNRDEWIDEWTRIVVR